MAEETRKEEEREERKIEEVQQRWRGLERMEGIKGK